MISRSCWLCRVHFEVRWMGPISKTDGARHPSIHPSEPVVGFIRILTPTDETFMALWVQVDSADDISRRHVVTKTVDNCSPLMLWYSEGRSTIVLDECISSQMDAIGSRRLIKAHFLSYDWGEPAVSYRWTGWVWEITGWSSGNNRLEFKTAGKLMIGFSDRGEPAVSGKWTGWVWEITGWSSRLQETYQSF